MGFAWTIVALAVVLAIAWRFLGSYMAAVAVMAALRRVADHVLRRGPGRGLRHVPAAGRVTAIVFIAQGALQTLGGGRLRRLAGHDAGLGSRPRPGYQRRPARRGLPDVVVLDLGLPDLDGVEVCRRIRTWSDVPIVVLSADGTEDRKVEALEAGADDYITKPFGMRELSARLKVAVRHRAAASSQSATELRVGPLQLDLAHYQAIYAGRELDLTAREFEFLGTRRR